MSKSYKDFIRASKPLTDKDESIENFTTYAINKLESMFHYEGLPDTIPQKWLEYYLMCNGNCFIAKHEGKLYAFIGGAGGEYDAYYQPTRYVVSNPYLRLNKDYEIGVDGVMIRNDTLMEGMLPIIQKYGSLLTEADLTMRVGLINLRTINLISAPDDQTKQSADEYIKKVENGELSAIGENAFFNGVKLQDGGSIVGYLQQVIEATQYIKASFYNEIGLNANYNLKREYISDTENSLADDILLPLIDNMLAERQEGVEAVNKLFGTEITVELSSSWKTNATENEKEVATNEKVIEEQPEDSVEEQSEDSVEEQPEDSVEEQPEDSVEEQPDESEEEQPDESEEQDGDEDET